MKNRLLTTALRFNIAQSLHGEFLFVPIVLITIVTACSREKQPDTTSPRYHITQSEKAVIPASIELPANMPNGNARVATFYAEGVQKYKSQPKAGSNPVVYEWVFVAPEATLYDVSNVKIGTHGAGPFWQLSQTKDSIYAQHFSPAKSAAGSDARSIDWLLLMPKAGTTPTGVFADVSYIQRIVTQGGKAPDILPVTANESVDVRYSAVYRFTKKQ
ncbi:MAG TPA: DUF3455 domain-containing protein [Flavisolibacter sp.]|nr:DUF3455 domain-containing protein [Flavisolibacter sp.]